MSRFLHIFAKMSSGVIPKVFVSRNIPQAAYDILAGKCEIRQWESDMPVSREALISGVSDADALYCFLTDKIDKEILDSGKNLRVVATMSVGLDHIDVQECRKRGLRLGYTPDVLTEATAELTISLLLCTSRRLLEANRAVYSGEWGTWQPLWMCGMGLKGSTVGIVGLGRIGLSVAKKIRPFLPDKILYHNPEPDVKAAESVEAEFRDLDGLLKASDFVLCCCPLTPETTKLMDASAFAKMKPNAILINTSRGPVVDQEALYEALKSGRIRAAGLDVSTPEPLPPQHPLLSLPNFVMLPHIGSATIETRVRMATLTSENIVAALEGGPMPAEVPDIN